MGPGLQKNIGTLSPELVEQICFVSHITIGPILSDGRQTLEAPTGPKVSTGQKFEESILQLSSASTPYANIHTLRSHSTLG